MNGNPKTPWNPAIIADISPEDYEKQVVSWLSDVKNHKLKNFEVNHLEKASGAGGEYTIDAIAKFEILEEAIVKVLVECKRHIKPIERSYILELNAKLLDIGAHKAIIFSTSGFQKGALKYASSKGIATVTFFEGRYLYETRSSTKVVKPPPWIDLPKFSGVSLKYKESMIHGTNIDIAKTDLL